MKIYLQNNTEVIHGYFVQAYSYSTVIINQASYFHLTFCLRPKDLQTFHLVFYMCIDRQDGKLYLQLLLILVKTNKRR